VKKVKLSLKLTPGKLKQIASAVDTINDYMAEPGIAAVLAQWSQLPEGVRQDVLAVAPTFARLIGLAERMRQWRP